LIKDQSISDAATFKAVKDLIQAQTSEVQKQLKSVLPHVDAHQNHRLPGGQGSERGNSARGGERGNSARGGERGNSGRGSDRGNSGRGSDRGNSARGGERGSERGNSAYGQQQNDNRAKRLIK
jgi:hypothetical protein